MGRVGEGRRSAALAASASPQRPLPGGRPRVGPCPLPDHPPTLALAHAAPPPWDASEGAVQARLEAERALQARRRELYASCWTGGAQLQEWAEQVLDRVWAQVESAAVAAEPMHGRDSSTGAEASGSANAGLDGPLLLVCGLVPPLLAQMPQPLLQRCARRMRDRLATSFLPGSAPAVSALIGAFTQRDPELATRTLLPPLEAAVVEHRDGGVITLVSARDWPRRARVARCGGRAAAPGSTRHVGK